MDKDTERLKEYLPDYVEAYLTPSHEPGKYVCPGCKSGTKKNATGAFGIIPGANRAKCQSCGIKPDIFELIGLVEGVPDFESQVKRAKELYGDGPRRKRRKREVISHDFTAYCKACEERLPETDYLKARGISEETARRYGLGYDPAYNRHGISKALIIPVNDEKYIARKIEGEETAPKYDTPPGVGKKGNVFNIDALKTATSPVFIVEGALDALSIIESGGEAVPLEGVEIGALDLKENRPAQPLILALDNDKAGETNTAKAETALKALGVKYYVYDPYEGRKDANELLQDDPEALKRNVEKGKRLPEGDREEYLHTSALDHLQEFINGIADSANTEFIPTGFRKLDAILGGGLYEGLYFIGALPSLGKTTFVLQIADHIAKSGNDVIIFSLEMARTELMAKSISRLTLLDVLEKKKPLSMAKTDRGITTGSRYRTYSREERELIEKAIKEYGNYAGRIYIHEGVGDIGITYIKETVEKHIRYTGNRPVVIIDYLQILAPYSEKLSDKQNTDKSVLELKRLSRDYKLPVIGVSSLNRTNYYTNISMEAFKESGAIEYGCDVLIGLQLKGTGKDHADLDLQMKKNPREIQAVILKNRHGARGDKIDFNYYTLFNYLMENGG